MTRASVLAVLLLVSTVPITATAAKDPTPRLRSGQGIHVETFEQIDARQLHARITTDALQNPVDVRVLLPTGYVDHPDRRYPVLYLFHGTSGRSSDWTVAGDAVATTEGLPLIVVLPDAGFDGDGGGWFADWFNGGRGGPPRWETFHVEQVIPWIDANLRTIDERKGRAIAGLSQGGFGALSYAARHPELFTSVASFSGGCVIDRDPQAITLSTEIIQFTTSVLSGVADEDAIFGPRATQELNWQAHDPGTLVTNLRGMQIMLWAGDGTPGPLDPPGPVDTGASAIEAVTFRATELFHGYLNEVGIEHAYNYYGGGTHTFPYWARDLREYMGPLMRRFRHAPRTPKSISYLTTANRWQQWGWDVDVDQLAAFNQLDRARRRGFVFTGTAPAVVRTPGFFRRGDRYRVTRHCGTRTNHIDLKAGSGGRLRVEVEVPCDASSSMRVAIRRLGAAP